MIPDENHSSHFLAEGRLNPNFEISLFFLPNLQFLMSKLWVKFNQNNPTQVSTDHCLNVDDFIKQVKKELAPDLDSVPTHRLTLSTTQGGNALRPGLLITDVPSQPGYAQNTDESPLFVSVAAGAQGNSSFSQISSHFKFQETNGLQGDERGSFL